MQAITYLTYVFFRPLNRLEWWLDDLFSPVMRWFSGAPEEAHQCTHGWNNHRLSKDQIVGIDQCMVARCAGDPEAKDLPGWRRHMARFGGWKKYAVLRPSVLPHHDFYLGWLNPDGSAGLSRIPVHNQVRALIGPGEGRWFAVRREFLPDGSFRLYQVPLDVVGTGRIGDGGPYCKDVLL